MALYNLVRHTGAGHVASGSIALIATYFSIRAVLPGVFQWVRQNQYAEYLHSLVLLSLLAAVWRFFQAVFRPSEGVGKLRALSPWRLGNADRSLDRTRRLELAEWDTVRGRLRKSTHRGRHDSADILETLQEIVAAVKSHGGDERAVPDICAALRKLASRERSLDRRLSNLRSLDTRLRRFDLTEWHTLQRRFSRLSPAQQDECRRLFVEQRSKVMAENAIEELIRRAQESAKRFSQCLDQTCRHLSAGQHDEAMSQLQAAIDDEKGVQQALSDTDALVDSLLHLLEKQLAVMETATAQ